MLAGGQSWPRINFLEMGEVRSKRTLPESKAKGKGRMPTWGEAGSLHCGHYGSFPSPCIRMSGLREEKLMGKKRSL